MPQDFERRLWKLDIQAVSFLHAFLDEFHLRQAAVTLDGLQAPVVRINRSWLRDVGGFIPLGLGLAIIDARFLGPVFAAGGVPRSLRLGGIGIHLPTRHLVLHRQAKGPVYLWRFVAIVREEIIGAIISQAALIPGRQPSRYLAVVNAVGLRIRIRVICGCGPRGAGRWIFRRRLLHQSPGFPFAAACHSRSPIPVELLPLPLLQQP
jgi:hypothetical protein